MSVSHAQQIAEEQARARRYVRGALATSVVILALLLVVKALCLAYRAQRSSVTLNAASRVRDLKSLEELEAIRRDGQGPVLVMFWAPWCLACKANMPVFEALAGGKEGDTVRFIRAQQAIMDEDSHGIISELNLSAFPTFALFVDGKLEASIVGGGEPRLRTLLSSVTSALQ
jgi:thiol:disulfide interchange protein